MDDNKKIVYSEPTDYFPEEIRKSIKSVNIQKKIRLKIAAEFNRYQ